MGRIRSEMYDIKELGFIPPKYGGVSVSILRLIKQLTKDGFLVGGFYTSENHNEYIKNSKLFEPELGMSIKKFLFRLPVCLKILKKYRILHSHYSLEHMLYMWCFLRLLHKKLVITVHNSMAQSFYTHCGPINRFFLKRVANHHDVTWIAVSNQAKDEMLRLPIFFCQPIHVIPAYIPDTQVEPDSLPPSLIEYMSYHKRNMVFYGHSFMVHDGKDVYGFTDALHLYARLLQETDKTIGFIFCISDSKDTSNIEMLHHKSIELGIDDKIYWQIGALENMNAIWRKCDVYIRPTCTDGDSLAVREALDMGAQVVASDVCWRPHKVIKYHYGNIDDFYLKLKRALSMEHGTENPDFSSYLQIKNLYEDLLKK